ncbi:hypothetical protein M501DRAFT_901202, partial [Patellaria atrata CBS 101060]
TELCYLFSTTLPKLSVLVFYLRIFFEDKVRRAIYLVMGIVSLAFIINLILVFTACIPLAYRWDKCIEGGRCFVKATTAYTATSLPNIITDIDVLLLPLPTLLKLQISMAKKIGLIVTFILSSL